MAVPKTATWELVYSVDTAYHQTEPQIGHTHYIEKFSFLNFMLVKSRFSRQACTSSMRNIIFVFSIFSFGFVLLIRKIDIFERDIF